MKFRFLAMFRALATLLVMAVLVAPAASAQDTALPAGTSFDQTNGVLMRARAVEDIEYKIMVQRATQAAIYYMPGLAWWTLSREFGVTWEAI